MKAHSFNLLGAMVLLGGSLGLVWQGQPGPEQKWQYLKSEYEPRLVQREVHVSPTELLHLMNDDYVQLRIWDLRSESDWNQFRLADSVRVPLAELAVHRKRLRALPDTAVLVFVGNDELLATQAWKQAMALASPNAYILDGGLNHWLNLYGVAEDEVGGHGHATSTPDGRLRHPFKLALGDRHAASRPDEYHAPQYPYEPKVKLLKKIARSRGCG